MINSSVVSQWMPNDVELGKGEDDSPSVMLLTGPNMVRSLVSLVASSNDAKPHF